MLVLTINTCSMARSLASCQLETILRRAFQHPRKI
jgi:hypothetical protein